MDGRLDAFFKFHVVLYLLFLGSRPTTVLWQRDAWKKVFEELRGRAGLPGDDGGGGTAESFAKIN